MNGNCNPSGQKNFVVFLLATWVAVTIHEVWAKLRNNGTADM
jgi:hypothetical protein